MNFLLLRNQIKMRNNSTFKMCITLRSLTLIHTFHRIPKFIISKKSAYSNIFPRTIFQISRLITNKTNRKAELKESKNSFGKY